jgi:bacterioferritin-associated ferredoxin
MYLCLCKAVTSEHVREIIESGARDMDSIRQACDAGSDCGTCRFKINKLLLETTAEAGGGNSDSCKKAV